jgi:hypothetical protein
VPAAHDGPWPRVSASSHPHMRGDTAVAQPLPATCPPSVHVRRASIFVARGSKLKPSLLLSLTKSPPPLCSTLLCSSRCCTAPPLLAATSSHQHYHLRVSSSPRRCDVLEPSEQLALRHGAIPTSRSLGEAGIDRSSAVKTSPGAGTSGYGTAPMSPPRAPQWR